MSKSLPELISTVLAAGNQLLAQAEKNVLLLPASRQQALQPVFVCLKECIRVQKKKKALALAVKKYNALHEYKRKQAASLIIQTIAAHTESNRVNTLIYEHHTAARWYMQRRLTGQALHHIDKAIHLAEKYDRWHYALDLARFRFNILKKQPQNTLEKQAQQHYGQVALLHTKIALFEELETAHNTLFIYYKTHYRVRHKATVLKFERLVKKCSSINTKGMGMDIQLLQQSVSNLFLQLKGDRAAALKGELNVYKRWKQNPQRITHSPWRFAACIANLLQCYNALGSYKHHSTLLKELKKTYLFSSTDKTFQQSELLFLELQWRMNTGDFTSALQLVDTLEQKWSTIAVWADPARAVTLAFNCGVACFINHRFQSAVKWFGRIISFSAKGLRHNTRETAILLRNIAWFELGMPLSFPREKKLREITKHRTFYYRFEFELNHCLYQLSKAADKNEQVKPGQFQNLLNQLLAFEKKAPVKGIEGLQETKLWLQSRLNGKTMHVVMEQQLKLLPQRV